MIKIRNLFILFLALLLLSLFFSSLVKIPFTISSRAMIYPSKEWTLSKAGEGQMSYALTDHFNNSVSHYTITEFQRGDHGEFELREGIFASGRVAMGDTIGFIRSSLEQTRYLELQGELESHQRLLKVYMAGERAQDLAIAHERMLLAEQEYQAQKRLLDRAERLFQEDVIPEQEFELAQNEYNIRQMAVQIARSEYQAMSVGAKPEQLELVSSQIQSLKAQIDQLATRIEAFTILAPFSGIIIRDRLQDATNQTFIRIAQDSAYIAVLPVEVYQLEYIYEGQPVRLVPENRAQPVQATIAGIGNSVQLINRRQNVFITAVIDNQYGHVLPGMLIGAQIDGGNITLAEYARRISRTIFAN